jgi:hypothetical protein
MLPAVVQRALLRWLFDSDSMPIVIPGIDGFLSASRRNCYRLPVGIAIGIRPESLSASFRNRYRHRAEYAHSLAYDSFRGHMILFGGAGSNGLSDTWTWDGASWTERNPVNRPPTSWGGVMAYDEARREAVYFGGINDVSNRNNETWVWDGSNWTLRRPATSPSPRESHAMAYDAARRQIVLYGGYPAAGETWVWDGMNWTQKIPSKSPPPRMGHAMAYDSARAQVVLFGGHNTSGDDHTWLWDGSAWTESISSNSPPPRYLHTMAFDASSSNVLLFGGQALSDPWGPYLGDTWAWNGVAWKQLNPIDKPSGRIWTAMAYDELRRQVVLFGGNVRGLSAHSDEADNDSDLMPIGIPG